MKAGRLGAIDIPTALALLGGLSLCYAAWLTSIVFCASNDRVPLLVASAMFFPIGIVHGVGVWFGGW